MSTLSDTDSASDGDWESPEEYVADDDTPIDHPLAYSADKSAISYRQKSKGNGSGPSIKNGDRNDKTLSEINGPRVPVSARVKQRQVGGPTEVPAGDQEPESKDGVALAKEYRERYGHHDSNDVSESVIEAKQDDSKEVRSNGSTTIIYEEGTAPNS